jgi:3-dehydroquinate synthase
MAVIPVAIAGAPYDVRIEAGLLASAGKHCRPFVRKNRVAVVTDANVAAKWRETVEASFTAEGNNWRWLSTGYWHRKLSAGTISSRWVGA